MHKRNQLSCTFILMKLDCRSGQLLQSSLAAKDQAEFPLHERSEEEEEAPGR